MRRHRQAAVVAAVFACTALAYFGTYSLGNDHYDRLARARQIVMFGDAPFRDFFDPGYFLTLYTSALLERLLGDNLLGEFLLNVSFMAAGTTVLFVLASEASGSMVWGVATACLMVATEPRSYDYDKILFFPLGLYACWRYIDRPTVKSLVSVTLTTAVAGMFRYDSGLYLGAAAMVAIVARHWGTWRVLAVRTATFCLLLLIFLSPALVFIDRTAGLNEAFTQIKTYATREGQRGMFQPPAFSVHGLQGLVTDENAVAWLYHLAVSLPLATILIVPLRAANRRQEFIAKLVTFAVLAEAMALFILRLPIMARMPSVMPIVLVGCSFMAGEWLHWLRPAGKPLGTVALMQLGLIGSLGIALCWITIASVAAFIWQPPSSHFEFGRRLSEFARTPPALTLLPKGELQPVVEYMHDCTKPTDRIFATWFWPELLFFSGRGFAGGLAVVFGDHWSESRYQRRSLALFQQQSIPLVLTSSDELRKSHRFLWDYVTKYYEIAREINLGRDRGQVQIWIRRGLPVERWYAPLALPCFAPAAAAGQ